MAIHKVEKFLWINVLIDDNNKNEAEVEVKFEHGTDKKLLVTILEEALRKIKSGEGIEHTHEDVN